MKDDLELLLLQAELEGEDEEDLQVKSTDTVKLTLSEDNVLSADLVKPNLKVQDTDSVKLSLSSDNILSATVPPIDLSGLNKELKVLANNKPVSADTKAINFRQGDNVELVVTEKDGKVDVVIQANVPEPKDKGEGANAIVVQQMMDPLSVTGGIEYSAARTIRLADKNSNVGTFGGASLVPVITVDAKGQITSVTEEAVAASGGVSDGDKGDVTVSSSGTVWTVDNLPISRITNLQTTLDGKASTTHTHVISDVTGLQTALDGKASSTHSHAISDVTGLQTTLDNKLDDSQASAFGLTLLDDADASTARTTLELGTLATQSGTFSGTSSGTNTGDQNLFSTIAVSGQSNVVADTTSDTLTLVAGSNITITTDAAADSITIAASGGGGNSFSTIAVSGQSDVVADSSSDTLTLVAGNGVTLTTNAGTDTITLATQMYPTYYIRLNSNYTLTNTASSQKLFNTTSNGAITLDTGTYEFQSVIYITGMSSSAGNLRYDLLGAGTATLSGVIYNMVGFDNSTPTTPATNGGCVSVTALQAGANMVTAGSGTALQVLVTGMFQVTGSGTLIPSGLLVNAIAAVVQAGSYFKLTKVGSSTDHYIGNWS